MANLTFILSSNDRSIDILVAVLLETLYSQPLDYSSHVQWFVVTVILASVVLFSYDQSNSRVLPISYFLPNAKI